MTYPSPLRSLQEQAEAEFLIYGQTPDAGPDRPYRELRSSDSGVIEVKSTGSDESEPRSIPIEMVSTYGEIESEYAAIRKGAALIEQPHRATLRITGEDRHDFFNRMLTNDFQSFKPGQTRRTFWLSRQGRIQADLVLFELDKETLIDVDLHQAESTAHTLNQFLFSEDVQIEDVTSEYHHLTLHGPKAIERLKQVGDKETGEGEEGGGVSLTDLKPGLVTTLQIGGHPVHVSREDSTGEVGLELLCPTEAVVSIHEHLIETGHEQGLRAIGWHAYNISRLEMGVPIFNVDFGPDALPHETGLLDQTISKTKGCYLGQEVVARMENLGKPKRRIVGLKVEGEAMPTTGSQIFDESDPTGEILGAITSAVPSPMLGQTIIALATIRSTHTESNTKVLVNTDQGQSPAKVTTLPFWKPEM